MKNWKSKSILFFYDSVRFDIGLKNDAHQYSSQIKNEDGFKKLKMEFPFFNHQINKLQVLFL